MKKVNYKLLCWGHYSIPVPLWANWLAMDKSGVWYVYDTKPYTSEDNIWLNNFDLDAPLFSEIIRLESPQSGNWKTQLYWIG